MSSSSEATSQHMGGSGGGDKGITISSEIMVAAIIFFFLAVTFVFFLHLYAKWRWGRHTSAVARARARLVFGPDIDPAAAPRRGLDPSAIDSLPVCVYREEDFKEGIECAVCLSELTDGEKARLLPNCNHGFHLGCIDMWLRSHSTCPLCRNSIGPKPSAADSEPLRLLASEAFFSDAYYSTRAAAPSVPTNILFWGTPDNVNTAGSGAGRGLATTDSFPPPAVVAPLPSESRLAIDIPIREAEGLPISSLTVPDGSDTDDVKPTTPTSLAPAVARLKSFSRMLLTRERRVAGSSGNAHGCDCDIEDGAATGASGGDGGGGDP